MHGIQGTKDQYEIYLEIDSETSKDWNEIQQAERGNCKQSEVIA